MILGRVISRLDDVAWSAKSPDLLAPDYFLWGQLLSKVYANKLPTVWGEGGLNEHIRDDMTSIDKRLL